MSAKHLVVSAWLIAIFYVGANSEAADREERAGVWIQRTVETTRNLLLDPDSPGYDKEFGISMACLALGQHGRMNDALELFEKAGLADGSKYRQRGLLALADGLSSGGHIDDALKIVETIDNEYMRGTAFSLVAIRPSQRGDFEEAEALLRRITNPVYRDRAAKQICSEYIETGKYDDAKRLSMQISDHETLAKVEEEIESKRKRPPVTDKGYVEFELEAARNLPWGGVSASESDFLNHYYRAVVALELDDNELFNKESQSARQLAEGLTDNDGALLLLGRMMYKAGRKDDSGQLFTLLLDNYSNEEDVNPFDFDKMFFGSGLTSDAEMVAECLPEEELRKRLKALLKLPSATIVAAPLFGAVVSRRNPGWAEQVYNAVADKEVKAALAGNCLLALAR